MRYRIITGKLIARTAIHIGRGTALEVTDAICACDKEGNYILAGMPIAGALRTLATRLAPRLGSKVCHALWSQEQLRQLTEVERKKPCGCWVCHLFGDINPGEGETEENGGRASRLFVAHAKATLPENHNPRIRDGVGMNRTSGTACRSGSVKFDLEVLPKGTEFDLRLELEDGNEQDERLLSAILSEWQEGRAWLGGRVTRGLGAFALQKIVCTDCNLANQDGLMSFLLSDKPWKTGTKCENWLKSRLVETQQLIAKIPPPVHEGIAKSFVTFQFDLAVDGPFLINDTTTAARTGFDHAPLLNLVQIAAKAVLTGSSFRGVLRSHGERIARTLATLNARDRDAFLLRCPACNPVESEPNAPIANCDALLRKAKVQDTDEVTEEQLCLACRLFGSTRRGSRLIAEDTEGKENFRPKIFDFLAIDRFTGGGREGAKFDGLMLWKPIFPVRLYLENPQPWELGWLVLALRDLKEGLLSIGFGGAKGFGKVNMTSLTIEHGFLTKQDFTGSPQMWSEKKQMSGLYHILSWDVGMTKEWQERLRPWIEAFRSTCDNYRRDEKLKLCQDTYFDTLCTLYGKEAYQCLIRR